MCLLMTAPSKTLREVLLKTPKLLDSMYKSNSDGYGAMYGTVDGPKIVKKLPRSTAELRKLIERLPQDDRTVAVHLRMRTHGDIDLDNCHPYEIADGGGYLMHNGVLSFGNAKDTSKSDTWHYCRDHLDETSKDYDLHDNDVIATIGKHIGSGNVFALMTSDGKISVVNPERGIEVAGVFFSNLYAWEPHLLDPSLGYYSYYGTTYAKRGAEDSNEIEFAWAVAVGDADLAKDIAYSAPMVQPLLEELLYQFDISEVAKISELSDDERRVVAAAIAGDDKKLRTLVYELGEDVVVDALTYQINWVDAKHDGATLGIVPTIEDDAEDACDDDYATLVVPRRTVGLHEMTDDQLAEMYAG